MTQPKRCQYGVLGPTCSQPATTKRPRYGWRADETWDMCEDHAVFLDRLRANIVKHAELLQRLADS